MKTKMKPRNALCGLLSGLLLLAAVVGQANTVDEFTGVTLTGAGSSDPDSDPLTYAWQQTGGPAVLDLQDDTTATPSFIAPFVGPGGADVTFQLTVEDGYGGIATDTVIVHVQNANAPPLVTAAAPTIGSLWPPNHDLVSIGITGVSDPDNHATITIDRVMQDEPTNGTGDGDTAIDAFINADGTVLLRAERSGNGDGRVYHIHFTASNPEGSASGVVKVTVPLSKNKVAIDGGELYDSTHNPPPPEYVVIDLSDGPSASSYPASSLSAAPPGGWTDEYKTTKLVLRRIPAGTFVMGSPTNELGHFRDETQHTVTLTQDFYIGVFEVTQRQWERVMGTWPSFFSNATYRESRPVEQVSYYEIRETPTVLGLPGLGGSAISPNWPQSSQVGPDSFMGKLRAKTGLTTLDLPTESQWEYACRAGTTTALNSGYNLTSTESDPRMDEVGRYEFNGGLPLVATNATVGTAIVGSYLPNAWGLYDLHGNVVEWCLDWMGAYPGTVTDPVGATDPVSGTSSFERTARGGSWIQSAQFCRSASRSSNRNPDGVRNWFGFRVAVPAQ